MRFPKFTLRLWMVAVALLGVVLALPPTMFMVQALSLFAISTAVISQLPYRVRLAIEISIAIVLLVLSAWAWQSHFYGGQADQTWELACQALDWAATSKSAEDRAILRRESAWFARRSITLRCRAMWIGLFHGPSYPFGNRQENCYVLDMMWEIKDHEDAARKAHMPALPGR